MNVTFPFIILIIDVCIIYVLAKSYIRYRKRILTQVTSKLTFKNYNLCRLLLIANSFAMITAIIQYLVLKNSLDDVVLFGRFADRYVMFFAYQVLDGYEDL